MSRSLALTLLCAAVAAQQPSPPIVATPIVAVPAPGVAAVTAAPTEARDIDLAICLDISGSMQGLIDAARQNLWAVVNELATLQPAPRLRVALLTYGCQTHEPTIGWVKVETPFTQDLDHVSQLLFALSTNGGEEYVERVLQTALEQLEWSQDGKALKMLFVAGNEPADQDPKIPPGTESRVAIARGIVVNAIHCRPAGHGDEAGWRAVAQLADGKFAAIDHNDATVVTTPFDEQLSALSVALNGTYVPYGRDAGVWVANQSLQDSNATTLNTAAAAQRCQTKATSLYVNSNWDLVDATKDAKFSLAEVKKEDLPKELQTLALPELKAHVEKKRGEREALQKQVMELGQRRDAFVLEERKKSGDAGQKRFDEVVLESVRQQAEAHGFAARMAAPAEPETKTEAEPKVERDVDSPFTPVIKAAANDYRQFVRVTGTAHMAPTDCRMPAPIAKMSTAETAHGKKLYLLYARQADGLVYVKPGEPAAVGQTLVKESWQAVAGAPNGPTEASARYPLAPSIEHAGVHYHAGDAAGLFVMHKLAADTKDTDQGWVYGTVDRRGLVTSAGRVASCMRCHEEAPEDRRFGLR